LIGLAALGNVLRRSNNPDDLSGIVEDDPGQAMQQPNFAVRQNNPGLYPAGRIASDQFLKPFPHPLAVLLVDGPEETIVTGQEFVRREPK
jgi:hypothetical protein